MTIKTAFAFVCFLRIFRISSNTICWRLNEQWIWDSWVLRRGWATNRCSVPNWWQLWLCHFTKLVHLQVDEFLPCTCFLFSQNPWLSIRVSQISSQISQSTLQPFQHERKGASCKSNKQIDFTSSRRHVMTEYVFKTRFNEVEYVHFLLTEVTASLLLTLSSFGESSWNWKNLTVARRRLDWSSTLMRAPKVVASSSALRGGGTAAKCSAAAAAVQGGPSGRRQPFVDIEIRVSL